MYSSLSSLTCSRYLICYSTTTHEKVYSFQELVRQEEHLYELILPYPSTEHPISTIQDDIGFEWELFLKIDGMQVTWPIEVGWEPFRLPEVPAEKLELKALEKVKTPEKLPRL